MYQETSVPICPDAFAFGVFTVRDTEALLVSPSGAIQDHPSESALMNGWPSRLGCTSLFQPNRANIGGLRTCLASPSCVASHAFRPVASAVHLARYSVPSAITP